jgi:hypothetical protein
VDDTLNWTPFPVIGGLSFHPSLPKVLKPQPGAAREFRAWAEELAIRCETVNHVCAAHLRAMPDREVGSSSVATRVREALKGVEKKLASHEEKYG